MCRIVFVANVFYFFYDLVELLATGQDLFEFIRDTFTVKNLIVFLLLNESPPCEDICGSSAHWHIAVWCICYG